MRDRKAQKVGAYSRQRLCWFPVAAMTNYHRPGGSKQQAFTLSQFRSPEEENRGVLRALLLPETPGEASSCLLQPLAAPGLLGLGLNGSYLRLYLAWPSSPYISLCPLLKRTVTGFRACPNPERLCLCRNLITSAKILFTNKVTFLGSGRT